MTKSCLARFIIVSLIFVSCTKNQDEQIDVSKQWQFDYNGNLVQGQNDDQWQPKDFTAGELSLFKTLDTVNLTGTSIPDSIFTQLVVNSGTFPNPFGSQIAFYFHFPKGFDGLVIFKYVIVNSHLNILEGKAGGVRSTINTLDPQHSSNSEVVMLQPVVPVGQYRIYFTLSTESHPHFFESWGNIEKTQ